MYYVYVLRSVKHNRIYIGLTQNLNTRIKEHNAGKTKSTKFFKPWVLLRYEELDSRKAARAREKALKSGFNRERLKRCIPAPVAHKDRALVS
ncbi:MAG: GIY-YIG nuclease family protein [Candidatus Omnitrophota bacterium]|nr:GIY-YIG nuclease family protein [Candidatus Omnitrophota bacterium]